jgi:4-hydroxy-tetrahydrodipicolinate synthase
MLSIHGIVPAVVTPLHGDEEVNEPALRRLVNHLIESGVHGLFVLGSQGEFWAFDRVEAQRILETAVEEAAGRVPVYGGATALTTRETIARTLLAEQAGVDAVSVLTPFFVSPSPQELYEHYAAVAAATNLPIMLYNNPGRTGVKLAPDTVAQLALIENIIGIKDSSGELALTAEYLRLTPDDFAVLMGNDALIFAGLVQGCVGAIAASANVIPRLVVEIYDRFQVGDLDGARTAQEQLAPLRGAFNWGTFPVVIKEAMDLAGWDAGPARQPIGPLSDQARADLAELLALLGVL